MATLRFIGAAHQVTGSCHLLSTSSAKILLDCGMYQGSAGTEANNRRRFPFDPRSIDAVVLSHAHLDHSGLLPRLVKSGFRGSIYATPATRDLLELLLKDAAFLEEKDIDWENKRRRRAGRPLLEPIYTAEDVAETMTRVKPVDFDTPTRISEDLMLRFVEAGHILGAASVELRIDEDGRRRRLVYSGDLGDDRSLLLRPPTPVDGADVLLMESTYGDRDHRPLEETIEEFADILQQAHKSGGNVLIPSFAVGRAQEVLYLLGRFHHEGRLPQRAVFLDSPMAISATEIHHRHMELFNQRDTALMERFHATNLHAWLPSLRMSRTPEESMAINKITGGAIVIAGSGMCNGGRIRHHFKYNLWRPEAHVVIVGFQARGTPGRALVDGASHIQLLGSEVAAKAHIHTLGGFSAHAGQTQLLDWLGHFRSPVPRVHLVHGEPDKAAALAEKIRMDRADIEVSIAEPLETVEI
ncbi:MAG: MBL fold metallo-hydrolase [Gammaproteobacteria bacterium]|jgi:metallo-beta-lactamase family protein|nr:MBL fold metallo-hydrolase [Gammaproteobacteria bacterium]